MSVKSAGKKAEGARLNRVAVVDRALDIADREGLDAVSVRRMAQEFDVTPMALYWHFKNRDEMRAALGDRIVETVIAPDEALSGQEFIRQTLAALIDAMRRHPVSAQLVPGRILQCAEGRDLTERVLAHLVRDGYSPTAATAIARGALQAAVTLVLGVPGEELAVPEEDRDEMRRRKLADLLALPDDRFPHLKSLADELMGCDDQDEYFATGVDLFIDGVTGMRGR
ncbi:TetR/AcrR family transcriptional regulator C-terminal domain-containing protein [Gordonia sp. CPCC 206044]|uniref:TetR family transcriptional regulator n=1 Tax=Gordonia sp. CPCC 206044 TaxID=3140793 RepID=UPI003AF3BD12